MSFVWSEESGTVQQCVASLQKSLPVNYLVSGRDAALAGRNFSLRTTTNWDRVLDIICELTGHGWQEKDGTILVGSAAQFGSPGRLMGSLPEDLKPRLEAGVALAFKDLPLEQAAAFLQRTSGIGFKVTGSNLPAPATAVTVTTQTSLEQAVNILCILTGYVWEAKDGAITLRPDPRPTGSLAGDDVSPRRRLHADPDITAYPERNSVHVASGQMRLYTSDDSARLALDIVNRGVTAPPAEIRLYPLDPAGRPPESPGAPLQVLHSTG